MRSRLLSLALIGAALALGGPGHADPAAPAKPARVELPAQKYTLANGLEVVLHEDHRTPIVAVNIFYHVGSKDEPAGKNGFAHLFEHVMFKGSKNVPQGMFDKHLMRAGSSEMNGTTNIDRTAYYETLPSSELALALWLESDRMGFLLDALDQASFEREREVVKNERRQRYENVPYGLVAGILVRAALFPEGHPYHLATIGTPEDLDRASLDDVRAFFKRFYVPNNATLVIAGDLDPVKTKELVERYFGPIPRGADPGVKTQPTPAPLAGEVRLPIEADVELPRIMMAWPSVAKNQKDDAEMEILSAVLTHGKSSRLYKRLVYDLQIAQDVTSDQDGSLLTGDFQLTVTLKQGKSTDLALKEIDAELAKVRAKEPSEDELTRARANIVPSMLFGLESMTNCATLLNTFNLTAGDPGYLAKYLASYEAVRPADVLRAAQAHLPLDRRVVAIVTPTPGAPKAGRLAQGSKP
ncbi:MAG: pitrilysin family protein [Byssovorax sp.]